MRFTMAGLSLLILSLLFFAGCGGGVETTQAPSGTTNTFISSVGWIYENNPADYSPVGATCALTATVYCNTPVLASDIQTATITSPSGTHWTMTASSTNTGTSSSSGRAFIGGTLYTGTSLHTMPLAGTWTFQVTLKNGSVSTYQKTFHDPASSATATYPFVYTKEDFTPPVGSSQYIPALSRFTNQAFTVQYSAAGVGAITTTGLSWPRSSYLALEPRAYNMYCWLYDANKKYLGYTITEYSKTDHSRSSLIEANGELSIVPTSTISATASNGQVDLTAVKYMIFVFVDGAQYAPTSYGSYDYRSISPYAPVTAGP